MAPATLRTKAKDVEVVIERLGVSVFVVPTDSPEADGTLHWTKTTLVVVEVTGGGIAGLGYTYADTATAQLIRDFLTPVVIGRDAMAVPQTWEAMVHAIRHLEYFHDHVRIEHMLFDGALTPVDGELRPDLSRPGMGLELKRSDAARFAV